MLKVVEKDNGYKDLIYVGENKLELNENVLTLRGEIADFPSRESIQIGINQHITDEFGRFTNHSCFPSCRVVGNTLISVKELETGDSITFDYNETEDQLASPFYCHCCGKLITGRKIS